MARLGTLLPLSCFTLAAFAQQLTDEGRVATNAPTDATQGLAILSQQLEEEHKAMLWFLDQLRHDLQQRSQENQAAIIAGLGRVQRTLALAARWDAENQEQARQYAVGLTAASLALCLGLSLLALVFLIWTINRRLDWLRGLWLRALPAQVRGATGAGSGDRHWMGAGSEAQVGPRLLRGLEDLEERLEGMERQLAARGEVGRGLGALLGAESHSAGPSEEGASTGRIAWALRQRVPKRGAAARS